MGIKINFTVIVEALNDQLYNQKGIEENPISYTTNGYVDVIKFFEEVIWHSEKDYSFLDSGQAKEELKLLINSHIDNLKKYKL